MLPPRCSHPPCMNIEVKRVGKSAAGLARKRRGTNAHCSTKALPPLSSTKKKRMFSAISVNVTMGKVLRPELSSPIGNMELFSSPASSSSRYRAADARVVPTAHEPHVDEEGERSRYFESAGNALARYWTIWSSCSS